VENEVKGALVHFDRRTHECWKFLMGTDIFTKWINIKVPKDKEDEKRLMEVMESGEEKEMKKPKDNKRKKLKKEEEITYPIECRPWLLYFIYHEYDIYPIYIFYPTDIGYRVEKHDLDQIIDDDISSQLVDK